VESLTALAEHADGRLEIVDWSARSSALAAARATLVASLVGGVDA
jgi:hypothetical protein